MGATCGRRTSPGQRLAARAARVVSGGGADDLRLDELTVPATRHDLVPARLPGNGARAVAAAARCPHVAVLAIATSLALETLVAEAMLESNLWSPRSTLAILLAVTVVGSVAQLRERSVPAPDRAPLGAMTLAVAAWVWTTTTVVGTVVTLALIGLFGADVVATAISPADGRRVGGKSARRRRLEQIAVVIGALFVAIVVVRFTLILVDNPGPKR